LPRKAFWLYPFFNLCLMREGTFQSSYCRYLFSQERRVDYYPVHCRTGN
jgi:hypothetical protein